MNMAYGDPVLSKYIGNVRCSPLPEFLIPMHHALLEYAGTPRYYDPQTKELKDLQPVGAQGTQND